MQAREILINTLLMLLCYAYTLVLILVSGKMDRVLNIPRKSARKFLHMMIGNLPFFIPFFTTNIFPTLIAGSFILVTFLASPYSPFDNIGRRLKRLADITEEGHQLGLVFYAISYTFLALFFNPKPYVIAAGILPMAYGDAAASMVGEKYGRRKYKLVAEKSLEGSAAMFLVTFASFSASLAFFSVLYPLSPIDKILPALAVATVATLVEGFSPMGFDNLTVPAFSVLTFLMYGGGA